MHEVTNDQFGDQKLHQLTFSINIVQLQLQVQRPGPQQKGLVLFGMVRQVNVAISLQNGFFMGKVFFGLGVKRGKSSLKLKRLLAAQSHLVKQSVGKEKQGLMLLVNHRMTT
jgi:hypothetical protein